MTGLAGIASLGGSLDPADTVRRVERMGRSQAHRARAGWEVASHDGITYVVSDLPDGRKAGSPGQGPPARPVLTFDGVITNRREVVDELERVGVPAPSTDSDLVLASWNRWGPSCVERLRGRFAFVLLDRAEGTLFLARDRFGHKPLHYARQGDQLWFASEMKALLEAGLPAAVNGRALVEWSVYGDVLAPRTMFEGIVSLPPAHVLELRSGSPVEGPRPYYDWLGVVDPALHAEYANRPTVEVQRIMEKGVEEAVLGHVDGRSDVAVMLSGGVDSTLIAALAARHAEIPAYNFSIKGDARLDEQPMSERVARHLGLPFATVSVDADLYRREVAHATYLYEHPLWHMQGVPLSVIARRASEDGIGMFLTGHSIGPFFGTGTDRYRWILPPPALERVPWSLFRVARKAVYSIAGLPVGNQGVTRNLGAGLQVIDGGHRARFLFRCNDAYGFLPDRRERRVHVQRLFDLETFLPRSYHQGDRLLMAAGIEYCDAAADARFAAKALNLPASLILRDKTSKWLEKEIATRYVPREIAFQKKAPSDVPVDQYFAPMYTARFLEGGFLSSFLGLDWRVAKGLTSWGRDGTPALFQLLHLEIWGRLFFMGQSVDEVTDHLMG